MTITETIQDIGFLTEIRESALVSSSQGVKRA